MSSAHQVRPTSLLSSQFINGVYIPSALLMVGVGIAKTAWLPYAIAISLVLGGWKIYSAGNSIAPPSQSFTNKIEDANECGCTTAPETLPLAPKNAVAAKSLKPDVFQDFTLKEKTVLSHNTAIYRFDLQSPTQILGLPIGQHMSIAATLKVDGEPKQIVRSYTPISSDENVGYFDLLIKSYPQGNISRHIGTLNIGDKLQVRGPKGAMVYAPGLVKRFGMIAGGTGITPMLQIIRAIVRGRPRNGGKDTTEVDLIFANVNYEDILLKEDLDTLAKEDPGFRVHYVLNNPPGEWDGGVGFCTADMIKAKLPSPSPDMKLLMCGPPPMISAMKKAAESLGYDKPRPVSKLPDQVFCF